ncbi:hypothetical protein LDENG_00093360 [Lucifuga dentata]|nr:hypothetical protein LDENG_00093360 [Lucifuga dentata]
MAALKNYYIWFTINMVFISLKLFVQQDHLRIGTDRHSLRMFGSLLLCYFALSLIRLSAAVVHGNVQLDDGPTGPRRPEPHFLSEIERSHAPSGLDSALLPSDSVEDHFLIDVGSYDEDSSQDTAVHLQGRAMRSPRRCIPHQQSCLGFPLPCCDPCDTCYCRFFNAICYCRRVGHACNSRHT